MVALKRSQDCRLPDCLGGELARFASKASVDTLSDAWVLLLQYGHAIAGRVCEDQYMLMLVSASRCPFYPPGSLGADLRCSHAVCGTVHEGRKVLTLTPVRPT